MQRFKTSHILGAVVPLSAIVVVAVIFWGRWVDFKTTQQAIADNATRKVAHDLTTAISDREWLTKLFVTYESDLVERLLNEPENYQLYDEMHRRASKTLPDFVAFTLASLESSDVQVLSEDIEGRIGDICISDMKTSLKNGRVNTRLHPNAEAYHYDAIVPIGEEQNTKAIFLAAFRPDSLMRVLASGQPYQHELVVINSAYDYLIEFTSAGTREKLPREDFHLAADEKIRILSNAPIQDTQWEVLDLQSPGLYDSMRNTLLLQAGALIATFLFMTWLMLAAYRREERERASAEQALILSKKLLEDTNAKLETSNAQLAETAVTDQLTGLWNRRRFMERLVEECSRTERHNKPFSLIFADVDHFKSVNDRYGHLIGDKYLQAVANLLRKVASRPNDLVARYGGEEFVLLLPDTPLDGAIHVAELIRGEIEAFVLATENPDLTIHTTISLGVVSSEAFHPPPQPDNLISQADSALYAAKGAGRNCVRS